MPSSGRAPSRERAPSSGRASCSGREPNSGRAPGSGGTDGSISIAQQREIASFEMEPCGGEDAAAAERTTTQRGWNLGLTRSIPLPPEFDPATASVTDPAFEADSEPDIHDMFRQFNERFFNNEIKGFTLKWTKTNKEKFGLTDFRQKIISLCSTSLKAQKRWVTTTTLLHEMIHAYLDVRYACRTENIEHGPCFEEEVKRVDELGRCKINSRRGHRTKPQDVWYKYKCTKCPKLVHRTVNRRPDKNFFGMAEHERICGGRFEIVKKRPNKRKR